MKLLVAVIFEGNEYGAGYALSQLDNLDKEYLVDLEEAAIIKRRKDGKVELHQMVHFSIEGVWEGTSWANFVTLLCVGPLNLDVVGTSGSAFGVMLVAGDHGIEEVFIKGLREGIKPGSSAFLILVSSLTQDRFFEELMNLKGKLQKTFFFKETEALETVDTIRELCGGRFEPQFRGGNL